MPLLPLAALAHAGTYTDTVGDAASTLDLANDWIANFYAPTADVRLTALEFHALERDVECMSCSVDAYLWTLQSSGEWAATALGTATISGTTATWQPFTVASPPTLVVGEYYAIGFNTENAIRVSYAASGSALDTVWGVGLGWDTGGSVGSYGALSRYTSWTDDYGFYMKITVEAADDDGDGSDTLEDCDDADASAYPGAAEVWYDGVDQACDGGDDYDQDADGWDTAADGDCDDLHADAHPGGREVWYDGVDQDCSGGSDYDRDRDGDDVPEGGGGDCDDDDPAVHSGAPESWYDGVDQDCDGADDYDQDGDGHTTPSAGGDDCDDTDATRDVDCSDPVEDTGDTGTGGDTGAGDTGAGDTDTGDGTSGGTDTGGGSGGDIDEETDDDDDGKEGGLCMAGGATPSGLGLAMGLLVVMRRRRGGSAS